MKKSGRRRIKKMVKHLSEILSTGQFEKYQKEVNRILTSLRAEVWRRAGSVLNSEVGAVSSPFELVEKADTLGFGQLIELEAVKAVAVKVIFPIHRDGIQRPWLSTKKRLIKPLPPFPEVQKSIEEGEKVT